MCGASGDAPSVTFPDQPNHRQSRWQRDSQPAGRLAALAWRWHSIGDDHQSGHFQSTPTGVAIASARFVSQRKRLRGWIAALAKPESSATPTRGSVLTRGWDARAPIPGVASSDTQIFSALARIR